MFSARIIDKISIRHATILAYCNAIQQLQLSKQNKHVLVVDGNYKTDIFKSIPKGDYTYIEIAAASMIAKFLEIICYFYIVKIAECILQTQPYATVNHIK